MESYLDGLPLTGDEKAKLKNLAAETPLALLSMIKANPTAFEDYLGATRIPEILVMLDSLISHQERRVLKAPIPGFGELGAILDTKPSSLHAPVYDLKERDKLFDELRYWQSQDKSSDIAKKKIEDLTRQLNDLFELER